MSEPGATQRVARHTKTNTGRGVKTKKAVDIEERGEFR